MIWQHLHVFWLIKDHSEHRAQQKDRKGMGMGGRKEKGSGGQQKRREDNTKKKTEDRDGLC